jgi:hypothetical protein
MFSRMSEIEKQRKEKMDEMYKELLRMKHSTESLTRRVGNLEPAAEAIAELDFCHIQSVSETEMFTQTWQYAAYEKVHEREFGKIVMKGILPGKDLTIRFRCKPEVAPETKSE